MSLRPSGASVFTHQAVVEVKRERLAFLTFWGDLWLVVIQI